MNINVTLAKDTPDPYGPRYYFLHRENIQTQLKVFQEKRGCINPGHINRFRLLATEGVNKLVPFQGRETTWEDQEKFTR
jgi:hypothetical protein